MVEGLEALEAVKAVEAIKTIDALAAVPEHLIVEDVGLRIDPATLPIAAYAPGLSPDGTGQIVRVNEPGGTWLLLAGVAALFMARASARRRACVAAA